MEPASAQVMDAPTQVLSSISKDVTCAPIAAVSRFLDESQIVSQFVGFGCGDGNLKLGPMMEGARALRLRPAAPSCFLPML